MTAVTNTSISLAWLQPEFEGVHLNSTTAATATSTVSSLMAAAEVEAIDDAAATTNGGVGDIDFIVQFGKVNNMTMYETVAKLENVSMYYVDMSKLAISFDFSGC